MDGEEQVAYLGIDGSSRSTGIRAQEFGRREEALSIGSEKRSMIAVEKGLVSIRVHLYVDQSDGEQDFAHFGPTHEWH
jgi:hypothetical protein